MRKNYLNVSINDFIIKILSRNSLNKLFLFLGLILLSLNSYGQCNIEIPIGLKSNVSSDFTIVKDTYPGPGLSACVGCSLTGESNLTDLDETNFATASFGLLTVNYNHSLKVTDANKTYAAGTFAGFKIGPSGGLLSLDLLKGITIKTYKGVVEQETFSGTSLLSLDLLSNATSGYVVGFNTIRDFDTIEIILRSGVGLLNSTNIYSAVIREYCAGPTLVCNTAT